LNSWITLRTCDSSVCHMRAISGADMPVFDANRTDARWRVEKCFARFERRFNVTASPCANGRTNTSGGRITTSIIGMRPCSPPTTGFR
jgi:hypothetical protein